MLTACCMLASCKLNALKRFSKLTLAFEGDGAAKSLMADCRMFICDCNNCMSVDDDDFVIAS